MSDYKIKNNPVDRITHIVKKYVYGVGIDDPRWNKIFYPRVKKSCKVIYDYFEPYENRYEMALKCIEDLISEYRKKEMSYTIETVVKWVHDWERQFKDYDKFIGLQYGIK
jgi:hypothetical protein